MRKPFRWTRRANTFKAVLLANPNGHTYAIWEEFILPRIETAAKDMRPSERAMFISEQSEIYDKVVELMGRKVDDSVPSDNWGG